MSESKGFWRDVGVGVTKDLIVRAVTYAFGLPVILLILAASAQSVRKWLLSDSRMPRYGVVLLAWLLLIAVAGLARLAISLYRERATRTAAVTTNKLPRVPVKFAPESFELTPARRRALLVLRHRVDARTTLHELHNLVTVDGLHIDRQTTKAQLQHDMDAAERAGLVSIDRAGKLTQYYNLAIPDGRDWVLQRERELQVGAGEGMTRPDPRRI
jgi:hypothetical protein